MKKRYCIDCKKEIKNFYAKRCHSCAKKGKLNPSFDKDISGKNNPNYKHGQCVIYSKCVDCSKELKNYRALRCKKCALIYVHSLMKGKNHPNFEKDFFGKNNPNWKGGLSFETYPILFNRKLKHFIRDRDHYKCQLCHQKEINLDRKLDIHHIDYNKKNCKENNLISLCLICHRKTNGNREYWTKYFINIVEKTYTTLFI